VARLHEYFAADSRRAFQTALGALWLLDGALQFQPFMYSKGFVQTLRGVASGQPAWLASSIDWAAHLAQRNLTGFNTLFALTQVLIGLGLLHRRTVRPALAVSFAWAVVVWWLGEGFGMLFAGTANPLTGAPGAAILYAFVGLLVWPRGQAGGMLGAQAARVAWGALWLVMAWSWLLPANSTPDPTANAIMMAPAGMSSPAGAGWLHQLESSASSAAQGHGLVIAIVLAALSAAIGIGVAANWRPTPFLALAIVLSLGYWVIGQGFGGIFYTGSATDPNAGPPFVLLALVLYTLTPIRQRRPTTKPATRTHARSKSLAAAAWSQHDGPRPARLLAPLLGAVALAVLAVALADRPQTATSRPQPVAYGSQFDGLAVSPPVPAPPTSLPNYQGQQVSLNQYPERGEAVLVAFLSTRCRSVCPQIASELDQALVTMSPSERRRLQLVAVSTYPYGDTPASVEAFLREYGLAGSTQYLTGSPGELSPIWREWGISRRSDAPDVSGATPLVYGISAGGAVMTRYSTFFTPQQIVHDVKHLEGL
jgi:cytochrome oxidase Cu insertion factor (SCO1/SenC/PrrC family)